MAVLAALCPLSAAAFAEASVIQFKEKISLPKPTNVKTSSDNTSVTLTWTKIEGASAYRVYMLDSSDGKYHSYKTVKTTKCTVTGLKPNVEYSFYIQTLSISNGKYTAHGKTRTIKVSTKSIYSDFINDLKKKYGVAYTKSFTIAYDLRSFDYPDKIDGYISNY